MYDLSCEKRELQEAISNRFPSRPYSGPVLAVSHDPSVYDAEDENLDVMLQGKSWRNIDPQFVESNHDEYVLMNEQAVPAFLAAWLWKASDDPRLSNQVLASLVFHLATYGESEKQATGLWGRAFKGLNQEQRDVLRWLLKCAAENTSPGQDRDQISKALANVESNTCLK